MMFLVGFFLPAIIGLITRYIKDPDGRFWASAFICAVIGTGLNFLEHNGVYSGLTMMQIADDLGKSVASMIGIVKLSYELVWNNKAVSLLVPDNILDAESPLHKLDLKPVGEK